MSELSKRMRELAKKATPGPWYWREPKHTSDVKTSDPGGLHSRAPEKTYVSNDLSRSDDMPILFPVLAINGPDKMKFLSTFKKLRVGTAMEIFGSDEDKAFLSACRPGVDDLCAEIEALEKEVARLKGERHE